MILQGLNEAQCKAVLHGEGPALVVAGPGSGKTTVITRRVIHLLQNSNIPPQKILVLTFTKEAAKTMQNRFLQEIKFFGASSINSYGKVNFGTFHSFFYHIIKSVSKYSNYQIITQQEKRRIAKEVFASQNKYDINDFEISTFLSDISFYKNTNQIKYHMNACNDKSIYDLKEIFLTNFQKYEYLKHQYHKLDYDDMLYLGKFELTYNPGLLDLWKNMFSYILIDEAQDMNDIQYDLLRLITQTQNNIFLVGDDDQSIYGFRGSKTHVFQTILNDYPKVIQIHLTQNYRCSHEIIKVSKNLIINNKQRIEKNLVPADTNKSHGKVNIIYSETIKKSYSVLAELMESLTPEKLDNYAVLFRTNLSMQTFAMHLVTKNIPFVISEKQQNIYEHFMLKDILDLINASLGDRSRSLFLRIFQKMEHIPAREILKEEKADFTVIKNRLSFGFYKNHKAYDSICRLENDLMKLKTMAPALGIKYILYAMNYQNYLLKKSGNSLELIPEWKNILDWICEEAGYYKSFIDWSRHVDEILIKYNDYINETKKHRKGIKLLTLHASKGLEFDKVYIMNVNDGIIPQVRRGEILTEEKIEEERRLFYVGMTRAKDELNLYYVTGTKDNPKFSSRFLDEIRNK